jgi:hypothetical protein
MTDYPKVDPRDIMSAITVVNAAIDRQAGPPGEQVQVTRAVLSTLVNAANAAIKRQQSGGSGHS